MSNKVNYFAALKVAVISAICVHNPCNMFNILRERRDFISRPIHFKNNVRLPLSAKPEQRYFIHMLKSAPNINSMGFKSSFHLENKRCIEGISLRKKYCYFTYCLQSFLS